MKAMIEPFETELEVIKNIKRELIQKKKEIEAMTDKAKKQKALKAYAKFLLTLTETNKF